MSIITNQNYKGVIGDGRFKPVNQRDPQGLQEDMINLSKKVDGLEKNLDARGNEIAHLQRALLAECAKVGELNQKIDGLEHEVKNFRRFANQTISHVIAAE